MDILETFGNSTPTSIDNDPLYRKQRSDVAQMRTSVLACSDNPELAKQALQNITVLRVYHQIARIVRYLDMMDKIEDKLYRTIDRQLEKSSEESPGTLMMLLELQERLQKTMIDSQKLLAPYLELGEYTTIPQQNPADNPVTAVLSTEKREKLRNSAQAVLLQLNVG